MTGTGVPAAATTRFGALRAWSSGLLPPHGQGRDLYWSSLVNMTGTGMYLTSSALFFVRYLALPESQVALALTVSGLVGLIAGIPVGRLTDRRGAREVYLCTLMAEAVSMAALPLAHGFAEFAVLTTLTSLASAASIAARGPLIRATASERPTRLRAQIRSVTNIGIALGGGIAAGAIAANTRTGYLLLVLDNAASFALCALIVRRLPKGAKITGGALPGRWQALRDRPYLGVVAVNALIMLQYPVLTLVLPLWVLGHADVPRWVIATLIPINTLMVASLQVRMSRGIDSPRSAARLMPRAGLLLLAGLALMAVVPWFPRWAAITVLVAAVVVFTLGEILAATVGYELSFELAPAAAQGQYMGLYAFGGGVGRVVSPAVVSFLCLTHGTSGWIVFGFILLAACLPTPWIAASAEDRTAVEEPDEVGVVG